MYELIFSFSLRFIITKTLVCMLKYLLTFLNSVNRVLSSNNEFLTNNESEGKASSGQGRLTSDLDGGIRIMRDSVGGSLGPAPHQAPYAVEQAAASVLAVVNGDGNQPPRNGIITVSPHHLIWAPAEAERRLAPDGWILNDSAADNSISRSWQQRQNLREQPSNPSFHHIQNLVTNAQQFSWKSPPEYRSAMSQTSSDERITNFFYPSIPLPPLDSLNNLKESSLGKGMDKNKEWNGASQYHHNWAGHPLPKALGGRDVALQVINQVSLPTHSVIWISSRHG